jgi:hypothetical protein
VGLQPTAGHLRGLQVALQRCSISTPLPASTTGSYRIFLRRGPAKTLYRRNQDCIQGPNRHHSQDVPRRFGRTRSQTPVATPKGRSV